MRQMGMDVFCYQTTSFLTRQWIGLKRIKLIKLRRTVINILDWCYVQRMTEINEVSQERL